MNELRAAYEQTRYPAFVHPRTHPSRLAAVASLCGHASPDVTRARVLDIGCGSGTNLLAMAASLPGGQFFGVDFSEPDIAAAWKLAEESGASNIQFATADVMHWEPVEQFEYVIAYGLFSWVPDEVKDRLLSLISQVLAPGGVAAVSYAVYPGSKVDEGLRDLLINDGAKSAQVSGRVTAAIDVLGLLERAWSRSPDAAMASYHIERSTRIRTKSTAYLALDDLGIVRDPCYLTQFADWAWEHGLSYLGDADLATALPASLPPDTAAEITAMGLGPLEQSQFLDYVTQRTFRTSLLVKGGARVASDLTPAAIANLSLRTTLRLASSSGPGLKFQAESGNEIALPGVAGPVVEHLARQPHQFVPLSQAVCAIEADLGLVLDTDQRASLYRELLDLIAIRLIEVSTVPSSLTGPVPVRPLLSPINRLLARDHGMVVSMSHEPVTLTADEQQMAALLDGRHTMPMIENALQGTPLSIDIGKRVAALARLGCFA